MENKPTQKAKELKKREKGKTNKTKIAYLSPEDIKGITGGQRSTCGGHG